MTDMGKPAAIRLGGAGSRGPTSPARSSRGKHPSHRTVAVTGTRIVRQPGLRRYHDDTDERLQVHRRVYLRVHHGSPRGKHPAGARDVTR